MSLIIVWTVLKSQERSTIVVVFVVAKRRHYDTKKNIGIVLYFERYLRLVVPVDISLAMTIIVVVSRRR